MASALEGMKAGDRIVELHRSGSRRIVTLGQTTKTSVHVLGPNGTQFAVDRETGRRSHRITGAARYRVPRNGELEEIQELEVLRGVVSEISSKINWLDLKQAQSVLDLIKTCLKDSLHGQ